MTYEEQQEITRELTSQMRNMMEQNPHAFGQAIIDTIFQSQKHYAGYYFACALKEIITHDKDDIGDGYVWEKISKGMRELQMPIKEA